MSLLKTWVISFLLFFACWHSVSAFSGTEGASFLDIPVGGRPAALGGAYSALASDAYAPAFNPAGLGFVPNHQLAAMHLNSIGSISYEFASLVWPLSRGHSIGASVQYLRPGDTPSLDINGNSAGEFSGSFFSTSLGYGRVVSKNVSLGVVGKIIHGEIAGYNAQAYAADIGTLYQPTKQVNLAAMVSNIGTQLKFIDGADAVPLSYKLGGSYAPVQDWLLALQGTYARSGLASVQTGVEWTIAKLVALRVGYTTETAREMSGGASGISAGIGLQLAGQQFDYAWVPMADLGDTQYFSMVVQWGGAGVPKSNSVAANTKTSKPLRAPGEQPSPRKRGSDDDYFPPVEKPFPGLRSKGLHP